MKKSKHTFLALIVPCFLFFYGCSTPKKAPQEKPNVVFIFADDMTYSAINALGNKEIETPNLDRLVQEGTTFTHAYNMGSWTDAVCAASRAMLISGRSVWQTNQFRKGWNKSEEKLDKSWGKLMQSAGYETYMTGKWHVDAKPQNVFQNVVHVRPGMPVDKWKTENTAKKLREIEGTDITRASVLPAGYNRPLGVNDTSWNAADPKFGGFWEGGKHWSEVLKDDAIGFIDNAAKSDNPFFMYLAFNAPHDPRQAPQEFLDKYPVENISLPTSWTPEYTYKEDMGSGMNLRDEALAPFPRTEYATKVHIREYYALISHLDVQIGAILDKLEASGKMDNTYIIFTADHGIAAGRHGLIGKQSSFDHSIRAPFMIVGPNVPKNKRMEQDIYLQDAMATSLDLAGVKKPDYVFYNSFMDIIKGEKTESHYNAIYGGYKSLQRMIRKDGFKLILYPKIEKVLLFDLKNDPEEIHDLSDKIEYKEKVNTLFLELIELQKELKDPLDLKAIYKSLDS